MTALGPLVLVIEDEPEMRKFIRATLTSRGFRLLEAERASEGIQLLTSHNPDLVLLDLGLPDGDGVDLTRQLREWSRVPVIVLSARGREDDKVAALDAASLEKARGISVRLTRETLLSQGLIDPDLLERQDADTCR